MNPLLNAVVDERYRDALNDASEVDRMISEARMKGGLEKLFADKPFLGVPCTIKESCSLAGKTDGISYNSKKFDVLEYWININEAFL